MTLSAALSGAWKTIPIALLSSGAAVLALGWMPLAYLAPVPLTAVNWPATIVLAITAVALTAIGPAGYRWRDLRA